MYKHGPQCLIVLPGRIQFGSHPLVTKFVKGVFEVRPVLPRYKDVWDVNKAFKFLAAWTLGEGLNLKCLSWKLPTLLTLLSGQRVQTLKALTLSLIASSATKCLFTIGTPLKTTRPDHHLKRIEFLAHQPHHSCVVTHLQTYIDRTASLRGDADQLLIGYQKPHKPVLTNTISRWIKTVLTNAGIDTGVQSPQY